MAIARKLTGMKPTLEQLEPRLCPSAVNLSALPQIVGIFAQAEALVQSWEAHPISVAMPASGAAPAGYTPSQIAQAYGFAQTVFSGGVPANGAGQTIAIVDAFDDPNIAGDLQAFDAQFGLPAAPFVVVNQNGGAVRPPVDPTGSWELEEALDVEWIHALVPAANIVLVEANSSNLTDLLAAVHTAASIPAVSVVSMSWVCSAPSNETALDSVFTTPAGHQGVTFIAGSGDGGSQGAANWPSASPNVLGVGGTNAIIQNGSITSETAWAGSGGGVSQLELEPSWQQGVQSSGHRTAPDVSFNAGVGVAVYDSYPGQAQAPWIGAGGTSFATLGWAAILAIANEGRALSGEGSLNGPTQTLPLIYGMSATYFRDITSGTNGAYPATPGYDLVTGRGAPIVNLVVAGLGAPVVQPPSAPGQTASSPPAASHNPFVNLADLAAIAIEQFDSLMYRLLAMIDPRDFAVPAMSAQQQLMQNPLLPTPQGRQAAELGVAVFAQVLSP
jgi:subtilase family serine protease